MSNYKCDVKKAFDGVLEAYDAPGETPIRCIRYEKTIEYDEETRRAMDKRFLYSVDSLREKSALVVGAGTLGNEVVKDLIFSGVRDVTVVDMDVYEYYNLPRSTLIRADDVGLPKAEALARRAAEASPFDLNVTGIVADITRLGWGFLEGFDIVLSPVDSWSIRSYVSRGCHVHGIPHVSCGTAVLGFGEGSMMATTVTVEPAGCSACYECMVRGNLKDQERKLSCLDIEPETQPQVLSFSSVSAGFAAQAAVNILLRRLSAGTDKNGMPKAWSYQIREIGRVDDLDGISVCTPYTASPSCGFHSRLPEAPEVSVIEVGRDVPIRELWKKMNGIFGKDGIYEADLRWSSLHYLVYPEGATRDADRVDPVNIVYIDDRDDEMSDRTLIRRLPPDQTYLVTDCSRLDGESRAVRIVFTDKEA